MKKTWLIVSVLAFTGLIAAQAADASPVYSYAVKFVCGYNPTNVGLTHDGLEVGEPTVKFGNYATDINIYNPGSSNTTDVKKKVILLVKEGSPDGREPNVAKPAAHDAITLKPMEATMDDCNRIGELIYGVPPTPFPLTIGFFVIESPTELDVTAVYTAETCANWVNSPDKLECLDASGKFTDSSISIDVEQIEGRQVF